MYRMSDEGKLCMYESFKQILQVKADIQLYYLPCLFQSLNFKANLQ